MRFHFSCTRNPHTEREVYTMRTPRLRLLSVLLAVALFFTLLPVSALAEDGGSNANTGLTIGIVGNLNHWVVSHSISMKEVSPAVYEVTIENKSYGDINGSVGFLFVKDNSYADQWGSSVTASSGELHDAVYGGDYIKIDPGSDDESAVRNFIVRLDLTNWDWDRPTGIGTPKRVPPLPLQLRQLLIHFTLIRQPERSQNMPNPTRSWSFPLKSTASL